MAADVKIKYSSQEIDNLGFDDVFHVPTTEQLGFDGVSLQRRNASNLALKISYDSSSNPIYIGISTPGTLTSDSLWQIKKFTFDSSSNLITIQYAGGSPSFNQIWDNRSSLSYV